MFGYSCSKQWRSTREIISPEWCRSICQFNGEEWLFRFLCIGKNDIGGTGQKAQVAHALVTVWHLERVDPSLFVHDRVGHERRKLSFISSKNYFYYFLSGYHRLCDDIWCKIPNPDMVYFNCIPCRYLVRYT